MCPDWDDTVKDRENGEVVGHIGHDETIAANGAPVTRDDLPIEDVRKDAVESTEAAGEQVVDVPQPPADGSNNTPAPASSSEPGVGGPADNSGANANPDESGQSSAGDANQ